MNFASSLNLFLAHLQREIGSVGQGSKEVFKIITNFFVNFITTKVVPKNPKYVLGIISKKANQMENVHVS